MTRSNNKFVRAYVDGYDLSGEARAVGNYGITFMNTPDMALSDAVKNVVVGQAEIVADPLNAFLSPSASTGIHELLKSGFGTHTYTIALGANAVPAQGDHIFSLPMEQVAYQATGDDNVYVNVNWGAPTSTNTLISLGYALPFGRLLHAKGAETAVNTAVGIDDYGAATALGGIFTYHLFSSNGTVTLKAQDAATNTNPSFADITGATSGSINASVTPAHGMVALGIAATVRQYLRWQLVFGTATTATFIVGLHRRIWS